MFWPAYFILAYLAVGFQVGLGSLLRVWGAPPNFVLMAAVFIAINAPREPALLACFALGAMQDLVTQNTFGLYAFSYGLFGLAAAGTGQAVYRGHPLTHFSLTLAGGLIAALVLLVHGWLPFTHGVRVSLTGELWSALYSAIIAVPLLAILHRIRRNFGFQPARRRI
jgi:rod shape-determining protein MreD